MFGYSFVWLCNSTDCGLPASSVPGDSLGMSATMGCHVLLQEIYLTQGSIWPIGGRFCAAEPTEKPSCKHIHVQRMEMQFIFLEKQVFLNLKNTLLKVLFKLKQVLESSPKRSDKEVLNSSAG